MPASPSPSNKKVFVTGATGAVGAHVVPLLIAQGHDVTAVGRSPAKRARLASIGAKAGLPVAVRALCTG